VDEGFLFLIRHCEKRSDEAIFYLIEEIAHRTGVRRKCRANALAMTWIIKGGTHEHCKKLLEAGTFASAPPDSICDQSVYLKPVDFQT
jgi:hypothetical protein